MGLGAGSCGGSNGEGGWKGGVATVELAAVVVLGTVVLVGNGEGGDMAPVRFVAVVLVVVTLGVVVLMVVVSGERVAVVIPGTMVWVGDGEGEDMTPVGLAVVDSVAIVLVGVVRCGVEGPFR